MACTSAGALIGVGRVVVLGAHLSGWERRGLVFSWWMGAAGGGGIRKALTVHALYHAESHDVPRQA